MNKVNLIGSLALLLCSCASMLPVTGAMIGGAGGAIAGPLTAGLGAGAGYALGDMAQHSLDDSDTDSDIDAIRTHVEAITAGDVEALLSQRIGEERGIFDTALDSLYALLKFAGIVIALLLLVPLAYSWYRKKKAVPFYEAQERLTKEFDEVRRKVMGD
jgi:hypothetical protein